MKEVISGLYKETDDVDNQSLSIPQAKNMIYRACCDQEQHIKGKFRL